MRQLITTVVVIVGAGLALAACDPAQAPAKGDPAASAADPGVAASAPSTATTAPTSQTAASLEVRIADVLRCDKRPEATPILISMAESGLIDAKKNIGGDGVSCFDLTRPLTLAPSKGGDPIQISLVCAYDENYPDTTAGTAYTDLYSRGPGTSPGFIFAAYTPSQPIDANIWVRRNDGRADAQVRRWDEGYMSIADEDRPLTEVQCSNPLGVD